MKHLIVLLAFATPLFAVTTNEECRGYQQLATLYQVRELMLHGAGDYRIGHVVAASNGSGSDNFEAAGEHPFEVKVVVPAKRSLLNKNNPVYVGTLHVTYSVNGRTRTKDLPVNAWMTPAPATPRPPGGIAAPTEPPGTASPRTPGEAVVEIHFIQAVAEDDPANP